jgi:hypothetical protein
MPLPHALSSLPSLSLVPSHPPSLSPPLTYTHSLTLTHTHMHQETGLDPADIKVRAAQGFEAADYVVGGYWVWAKLIENLAGVCVCVRACVCVHVCACVWQKLGVG